MPEPIIDTSAILAAAHKMHTHPGDAKREPMACAFDRCPEREAIRNAAIRRLVAETVVRELNWINRMGTPQDAAEQIFAWRALLEELK